MSEPRLSNNIEPELIDNITDSIENEYLEDISPEERTRHVVAETVSAVFHQGPLPPPEELEKYNRATPDAADRIIAMAEHNQEHRQACEMLELKTATNSYKLGQWFGFIISAISLVGGFCLIYLDKQGLGTFFGVGGIASLVLPLILKTLPNKTKE